MTIRANVSAQSKKVENTFERFTETTEQQL